MSYLNAELVRRIRTMDFSEALRALKGGSRIARLGWNGKGMWICMIPGFQGLSSDEVPQAFKVETIQKGNRGSDVLPTIGMRTADGSILLGWLASQSDIFAEDWEIVE